MPWFPRLFWSLQPVLFCLAVCCGRCRYFSVMTFMSLVVLMVQLSWWCNGVRTVSSLLTALCLLRCVAYGYHEFITVVLLVVSVVCVLISCDVGYSTVSIMVYVVLCRCIGSDQILIRSGCLSHLSFRSISVIGIIRHRTPHTLLEGWWLMTNFISSLLGLLDGSLTTRRSLTCLWTFDL